MTGTYTCTLCLDACYTNVDGTSTCCNEPAVPRTIAEQQRDNDDYLGACLIALRHIN